MLTHDQVKKTIGVVDPTTGLLWAYPKDGRPPALVTFPNGVHGDYKNLLNASVMLYNIVEECKQLLNVLHDISVERGDEVLIGPVTQMAASCQTAQRCAIEGIDKIAARRK